MVLMKGAAKFLHVSNKMSLGFLDWGHSEPIHLDKYAAFAIRNLVTTESNRAGWVKCPRVFVLLFHPWHLVQCLLILGSRWSGISAWPLPWQEKAGPRVKFLNNRNPYLGFLSSSFFFIHKDKSFQEMYQQVKPFVIIANLSLLLPKSSKDLLTTQSLSRRGAKLHNLSLIRGLNC